MTTRYVSASGKAGGTYDTKSHPAPTVEAALRAAVAGDVIEIMDASVYKEPELVIDRGLTLTSSYAVAHPGMNPASTSFDPKVLPSLVARGGHRVLRVQGTPATRGTFGPVIVRGVRIRGGHARQAASADPGLGAGGGMLVVDADGVSIEQCVIEGNRTEMKPLGTWPEADRLALRVALLDVAGEVFSPTAEKMLNAIVAAYNRVAAVTGAPTLTPIVRATVIAEIGKAFDGHLPAGRPNSWLAGQAFGGGLATVWASPTVKRCRIRENESEGRGAGIAVVGFGWPTIEECWIDGNRSGGRGRRDGGGVGLEVALPSKLGRDLTEVDLVRFLTVKIAALKTTIASPSSSITLTDVMDFGRWLADPRSHPGFRGVKAVVLDALHGQFSDDLLYYAATIALSRYRWEAWERAEVESARIKAVAIRASRVTANECDDDGGGLYASVLSHVKLSGTTFEANRSASMGGGVRLTMGSDGELTECTVIGNYGGDRGGGIAGRNVNLVLTRTQTKENLCADSPGGGIAMEVASEGSLAGVPNLWTSILREVFTVHAVKVSIAGGSVAGNRAGYTQAGAAIPGAKSAKGGGLYLLRGAFPDAPSVELEVVTVASVVSGNVAATRGYPSKVEPGAMIAAADQRCIQDLAARREWTEVNDAALLRGGDLRYSS